MPTRKRTPSPRRRFIAKVAPLLTPADEDTSIPAFGQRKFPKKRRPTLHPLPAKAD